MQVTRYLVLVLLAQYTAVVPVLEYIAVYLYHYIYLNAPNFSCASNNVVLIIQQCLGLLVLRCCLYCCHVALCTGGARKSPDAKSPNKGSQSPPCCSISSLIFSLQRHRAAPSACIWPFSTFINTPKTFTHSMQILSPTSVAVGSGHWGTTEKNEKKTSEKKSKIMTS